MCEFEKKKRAIYLQEKFYIENVHLKSFFKIMLLNPLGLYYSAQEDLSLSQLKK